MLIQPRLARRGRLTPPATKGRFSNFPACRNGFRAWSPCTRVDFDLRHGEVHVLFGENGAGKSTLINIISGTYPPDEGAFTYQGETISRLTPHAARLLGISPVFQEFSLVPELTVEQNLFLGRELTRGGVLDRSGMKAKAKEVIELLGFDLVPDRKVRELSRAHQQMVEIAKAFLADVRLLILDEPTASLTEAEAEKLFGLVAKLKASGVGIIYVSHRMREIKQIADRITVLRDGRKITTVKAADVSENDLVELMTGSQDRRAVPACRSASGRELLEVEGLTLANRTVSDVSFYARAGEITGIAGLVGCGKSELVRAVYGLELIEAGVIRVNGDVVAHPTPSGLLKRGLCYFPSDRVAEGLALGRPVRENGSMTALDLPTFAARWRAPVDRASGGRSSPSPSGSSCVRRISSARSPISRAAIGRRFSWPVG